MKQLLFITLTCLFYTGGTNPYPTVGAIPLPTGYHRVPTEQGQRLSFPDWARRRPDSTSRASFNSYLTRVFTYCSTRTLEKQLVPRPLPSITAGDVLIKGGNPGHAMIVMDIAEDGKGHRIYLLAQSYMPAQDIHIVINPLNSTLSPWYSAGASGGLIQTPEWTFTINQLRMWRMPI